MVTSARNRKYSRSRAEVVAQVPAVPIRQRPAQAPKAGAALELEKVKARVTAQVKVVRAMAATRKGLAARAVALLAVRAPDRRLAARVAEAALAAARGAGQAPIRCPPASRMAVMTTSLRANCARQP